DLIPGNAVSAPTSTDDTSLDAGPFGPSEDLPRNTGSPSGGESSRDAQAGGGAGTPSEHQDSKAPELPSPFNIEANSGTPSAPAGSAVGPAQPLSTQVSPATTSASSSTSPTVPSGAITPDAQGNTQATGNSSPAGSPPVPTSSSQPVICEFGQGLANW